MVVTLQPHPPRRSPTLQGLSPKELHDALWLPHAIHRQASRLAYLSVGDEQMYGGPLL